MFQLATVFSVKSIVNGTKIVMEGLTKRTTERGFKDEKKFGRKGKRKISAGRYKTGKATKIRIRVTYGKEEH